MILDVKVELRAGLCSIVSRFEDRMHAKAAENVCEKSPGSAGEASPFCHWARGSMTYNPRPSIVYGRGPPPSRLPAAFLARSRLKSSMHG